MFIQNTRVTYDLKYLWFSFQHNLSIEYSEHEIPFIPKSFWLCAQGHQMLMTCAPGTMFDSKTLMCNHMTMVSCSTASASTMKSIFFSTYFAYHNSSFLTLFLNKSLAIFWRRWQPYTLRACIFFTPFFTAVCIVERLVLQTVYVLTY